MDDFDGHRLPPFPVDEGTLDLLMHALHPGPDAERTSLWDFLSFMSEMGGSDVQAAVDESDDGTSRTLRDQQYSDHCLIDALVAEIRRLREELAKRGSDDQADH